MAKKFLLFIFCFYAVCGLKAQTDTTCVHDLPEVEIHAVSKNSPYLSTSSQQNLSREQLQNLHALQVSDAVKHFSGVQVKDYGGVGGLKTVSLRSLGANHTNVIYDGLAVTDYQTGQTDLGRFSLDNVEQISLNIGASDNIFQTAQAQSLAGTLNITTQSQETNIDRHSRVGGNPLKVALKTGSFGFINPSLLYKQPLSQIFSATVSVDYLKTKSNYPFAQDIGYSDNEKQYKTRENSDVETLKLEVNLNGNCKLIDHGDGKLLFKNYFYTSDRGLPGPAFYHNYSASNDRLKDRNFFSQIHYQQPVNEEINFQTNAKFSLAHTDYFNAARQQTSVYDQKEFYLNATVLYQPTETISFSWANDGAFADFESNQENNVSPSRTSWLSALSGKYEIRQFNVTAKLLTTNIYDFVRMNNNSTTYNHLSPYLGFSVQPIATLPLRLRGFYKNTFRMPTFGDLYYSTVTRTHLKPEKAQQVDLGLTFVTDFGHSVSYFSLSSDVYWNCVRDKIVAVPTANMFLWSMENYGKVAIQGADFNATLEMPVINISGTYTHQNVINQSTNESATYNKQLPYTARHSASGNVTLKTPWVDVGYNIIYCGKRYFQSDNAPTSRMSPFAEQGVTLMRTVAWRSTNATLTAECLNIGNVQYEVVRSYPMPARSFRFGIKINY